MRAPSELRMFMILMQWREKSWMASGFVKMSLPIAACVDLEDADDACPSQLARFEVLALDVPRVLP